ncbi:wd repeat sam and u-box domain-containing protein [Anaeramoeba flamelloides]|uniref:Wd repeat sam and u-box domain-containing protein n=1 Tax=Anaeramoeba flamelloides TaxID=1746091 RepID=A0AAV7ZZR2_9EUKA|nr:wd repeat sam and u-box domain-containing protein [Anaeramoeba flamelloides]
MSKRRRRRRKRRERKKNKVQSESESLSDLEIETDTDEEIPEEVIKIPEEFLGPISFCIFRDPVKASDGFTYERADIMDWFDRCKKKKIKPISPMTNQPLENKRLQGDKEMKKKCEEFKLRRKEFADIFKKEKENKINLSLQNRENVKGSFQTGNSSNFDSQQINQIVDLTQINEQNNLPTNLTFEEQMKMAIELSSSTNKQPQTNCNTNTSTNTNTDTLNQPTNTNSNTGNSTNTNTNININTDTNLNMNLNMETNTSNQTFNTNSVTNTNTNTNINNTNNQQNRQLTEEEQIQLVIEMSLQNNCQDSQNFIEYEDQTFLEILERSKSEK